MKRRLLQLALLFGLFAGSCLNAIADGLSCLVVTVNGEHVSYNINEIRKITFDAENMFLNMTNDETATLPLSTLTALTIDAPTGISLIGKEKDNLQIKGNALNVDMQSEGTVVIYDAAGNKVMNVSARSGRNEINLEQLPKGVYIIKVNGNTQKIMNN